MRLSIFAAFVPAFFCLTFKASASPQPITAPAVTVFTEKAAKKSIFNVLTFPARVESKVNAVVRSEAGGAITKIVKPLGAQVQRGETVAIVKHTDPVYEYRPMAVVASVSGVVSDVHITHGSLVNKGDAIVTVTDPQQLRIMVEVTASDLPLVNRGLKGELNIAGLAEPVEAEVQGVSPAIDPMLGTATCELHVLGLAAKRVVAGMVGRVQFKVNQRDGFMLPDYAIVYRGESTFVRLVKDGKSVKIPVQLGERRQGQVEILRGLSVGDIVIDRASRFVADGAPVQVDQTAHE